MPTVGRSVDGYYELGADGFWRQGSGPNSRQMSGQEAQNRNADIAYNKQNVSGGLATGAGTQYSTTGTPPKPTSYYANGAPAGYAASSYTATGQPASGLTGAWDLVGSTGGGGGNITLSRGAYEDQQQSLLANKLRQANIDRALEALKGFQTGGGQLPGYAQYGGPSFEQARAASFARSKEQAGLSAQAAIKGLQGAMDARGLTGSTVEGQALGGVVSGAGQDLSNVIREQYIQDANQLARQAETQYQGAITQRGQDIQAQQAILNLIGGLY
jgi:hypothetical protein